MYCFSCGYYVSSDRITTYKSKFGSPVPECEPQWNGIRLPLDVDSGIPAHAAQWFFQYGFTHATLTKHNVLWSESKQLLIFPYFIKGELMGWQGRSFSKDKKGKWHTNGKPESYIYTLGRSTTSTIVLVESIISAIKVSRYECCSPLFGSYISNSRFIRLAKFYDNVVIWMDPDKQREAVKFAQQARLFGLHCRVILSKNKPKDHTPEEIQEYLK